MAVLWVHKMRGIPYHVRVKLERAGIVTGDHILAVTRTPDQRRALAETLSLSMEVLAGIGAELAMLEEMEDE